MRDFFVYGFRTRGEYTKKSARSYDDERRRLESWLGDKNQVIVTLGDMAKVSSVREILGRNRLASVEGDADTALRPGVATGVKGSLLNGFELPGAKLVVISEKDIFGRQKKRLSRISKEDRIHHFREINVGDYVVHSQYGIGKYCGVKTEEINGIKRDYLYIQYGGEDRLFVPTDQVSMLQKYIGKEGEVPRLHKIGSSSWTKTKNKVRSSVKDIAKELIQLYATRKQADGYAYSADTSVSQCAPPFQHSGNYCFYIIKNMNTTNETIKIIDYSYRGVKIFTVRHPLHSVDKHKSFPPFSSKNC